MPIDRLPKQIMYGELTGGKLVGQLKLRYKDVIKRDLKDYGIDRICTGKQMLKNDLPGEPVLLAVLL